MFLTLLLSQIHYRRPCCAHVLCNLQSCFCSMCTSGLIFQLFLQHRHSLRFCIKTVLFSNELKILGNDEQYKALIIKQVHALKTLQGNHCIRRVPAVKHVKNIIFQATFFFGTLSLSAVNLLGIVFFFLDLKQLLRECCLTGCLFVYISTSR